MYILYAGSNTEKGYFLENILYSIDKSKTLLIVKNGYQLLSFLQRVKKGEAYPELIILEVDMPRLNGQETLELLKTDDIYRLIPVVVLCSNEEAEIQSYCYKMGADCMPQPYSNATWMSTVQQLCDRCIN